MKIAIQEDLFTEAEEQKMLRRHTRQQKTTRRSQSEQTHRVKTKYDRKRGKRDWQNYEYEEGT